MRRAIVAAIAAIACLLLVGVGLAAWMVVGSTQAPEVRRPNVLVIVWDTVRADHLSVYGYPRPTSPGLERIAAESAVYEQARSPGIWTLPAHAALFTGLPPISTGADERWIWLDHQHLTMAEWFQQNGYETMSFSANPLLSGETNLTQGFETVRTTFDSKSQALAALSTQRRVLPLDRSNELTSGWKPPAHGARNAEWGRARYKDAAGLVSDALLRWIGSRGTQADPFFVYLNFMEAHTPRNPSLEGRKAIMDADVHARSLITDQGHINLHFYNFGKFDYTRQELEAITAVYDATLTDLDRVTTRLLLGLAKFGILNDTIVVITSDHGENLGDHHLFNHRFSLNDSLARVPLIIRYPRVVPPARIDEPVSTIDIFGTLVDLAGLPDPPTPMPLRSLRDARGSSATYMASPLRREIETVQRVYPDVEVEPWLVSGHGWVSDTWKLIRTSDERRRLYDVGSDPDELNDVADADRIEALEAQLEAYLARAPAYDASRRTEADHPKTVRATQDELRKHLEALGYASGSDTDVPEEPEESP